MGQQVAVWLPAVVVAHLLGCVLLLYSLEKVSGAVSKNWKRVRSLLRNRKRVDDGAETPHEGADLEARGAPPLRPKLAASKWRRGDSVVGMAPSASHGGLCVGGCLVQPCMRGPRPGSDGAVATV